MTDSERIAVAWPEWETVREIGQGSFSTVYEVRNQRIPGLRAAVKVIQVPPAEEDIRALRADGFKEEEIRKYLEDLAEDSMAEIRAMKRYRGMSHFVSLEDCKVIPREDASGFESEELTMNEKVYAILREYMEDQTITITPDKSLITELGLKSIDLISAIGNFEDAFDIEIPDSDLRGFKTAEDILQYITESTKRC